MFNLLCKRNNVKVSNFAINDLNNSVFISSNNNVIKIDDKDCNKQDVFLLNSIIEFILKGNIWIANLENFDTTIYNIKLEPLNTVNYIAAFSKDIKYFSTQDYIYPTLYFNESFDYPILGKVSKLEFNVIETYNLDLGLNGVFLVINDDSFISKNNEKIVLSNFKNEIIWQQSFSDLLPSQETEEISISQEIIEISNIIYFTLNTNNQNICFGLDAQTGKVVKQFPNILGDLIQENEYIYFLYYNSITRLNTTNDTIEKWDIQDLLDKEDIGYLYFPRWAVLDGQIYFSQTKGSDIHSGKIGARFGVLDFNKRELIFKDQLDPKYGTIGSIKMSKERLYLHTQDSTLHVFEKE
ncbi:hypothetical protein V3471_15205 [Flavobacterium oreochromis]